MCIVLSSSRPKWKGASHNAPAEKENEKGNPCDACFARHLVVIITTRKAKANQMMTMLNAALGTQTFPRADVGQYLAKVRYE